jgi:hypothetical protein
VLREKRRSVIEATAANIWVDISSTKPNRKYLVRVLAVSGMVEPMVNFSVGREGEEEVIEVCLIGTISGVVTLFEFTKMIAKVWPRDGLGSENENGRYEEN